jgi:hypothetical protein
MTNTLAYFNTELFRAVKSFMKLALGAYLKGRLPALSENVRLGWMWLSVVKTFTYFYTVLFTAVKGFMIEASTGFVSNQKKKDFFSF